MTAGSTIIIGLYGGVAAGKSTVAALFAEHGAVVLDADAAVTAAYARDDVRQAVCDRFGATAYGADGQPDRKALANITFSDPQARADLEAILHPVVHEDFNRRTDEARATGAPAIVFDVPLLASSPLREMVSVGVFIDAPLAVRERRARESRGWEDGEVARRDAAQTPLDQKRALAAYVVANADPGSPTDISDLRRQVTEVWTQLKAGKPPPARPAPPSRQSTPGHDPALR